jgi:cytochrome c oxidase subunit III
MWFAIAAILMLFVGLTSAYVVRRGLDPNWASIPIPGVAFVNAVLLMASSFTLEVGRRSPSARRWLLATCMLGLAFATGQLTLWRQLAAEGLYLDTNAHASFIYLLTALHGLHLLGGMVVVNCRSRVDLTVVAIYWHFLGGLWIYLLVVLFAWR